MSETKAQTKAREQEEARTELRKIFPAGSEVSTLVLHVSQSGMQRAVAVLGCDGGRVANLSWLVARATDHKLHARYDGVKMDGAGMDMGFALVYNLSRALYRDGFDCIGEGCPSNDHVNERVRLYTPGRRHSDPGYALRQRWIS